MKIVVAYKWAANPQEASVDAAGQVDWSRAKSAISEYDLPAIELGRRLADATGAELIGVSVGGPETGTPMATKAALARRLDRLCVVADDSLREPGTTRTGLLLAEVVKRIGGVDVVLAGDSSIDNGAQLVPAVLAGALGWPALAQVTSVSGAPGSLSIERNHLGGSQRLTATGPVVLSVAPNAVTPTVPGMKDILAGGKKPVERLTLEALAVGELVDVAVVGRSQPNAAARKRHLLDGADPTAAATMAAALKAAGLV